MKLKFVTWNFRLVENIYIQFYFFNKCYNLSVFYRGFFEYYMVLFYSMGNVFMLLGTCQYSSKYPM